MRHYPRSTQRDCLRGCPCAGPRRRGMWRGPRPRLGMLMTFRQRVFSGVQPTGNLHLGNYLGAITRFVALQAHYECLYCVVDLHAITQWQDPAEWTHHTREVTAAIMARGIYPKMNV